MISPEKYGVSFSLKQCRNFDIDAHATLAWLLAQGWRRFRLMSYWNEHEKQPRVYDFTELDLQIAAIEKAGGVFSLCLGIKQPRWPEYHWPDWALKLPKAERDAALLQYIEQVVMRYASSKALVLWQLENEALLQGFGRNIDIDRSRLRQERALVQQLDPTRPLAMSTSNGWGVPLRKPKADMVGFSFYPIMYKSGAYHTTIQKPWLHKLRKLVITALLHKQVFIHELQCEPWGPAAIWNMSVAEQDKSMDVSQIQKNIAAARKIGAYPIDLWGAEWWYWRSLQTDNSVWQAVVAALL